MEQSGRSREAGEDGGVGLRWGGEQEQDVVNAPYIRWGMNNNTKGTYKSNSEAAAVYWKDYGPIMYNTHRNQHRSFY